MVTQIAAGRVYDYSYCLGRGGITGIGFQDINGIAIGPNNTIYVLNRGGENIASVPWNKTGRGTRVGVFDLGNGQGEEEFLTEFGKYGDGAGEFIWPSAIALDREQRVFVSDEFLNSVSIFDSEGNFLKSWQGKKPDGGLLQGPSGIAISNSQEIYIVESHGHKISQFSLDGDFIREWGSQGSDPGMLDSPWGIAIDSENNTYVADHKNDRVQKFGPTGEILAIFGSSGTGRGELIRPSDVSVDDSGDVYVCDWANSRIQIYSPDGRFITSLMGDARDLSMWSQMMTDANPAVIQRRREVKDPETEWRLALPVTVVFDNVKSQILIGDTQRNRIQIYNKLAEYNQPQRNL